MHIFDDGGDAVGGGDAELHLATILAGEIEDGIVQFITFGVFGVGEDVGYRRAQL